MTQTAQVEGHVCPECGNVILTTDDPSVDHHADCPAVTNYWTVHYGNECLCFLCDEWLLEDDTYRLIPMPPEFGIGADELESAIGVIVTATVLNVVCLECSRFKALKGGMAGTTPT